MLQPFFNSQSSCPIELYFTNVFLSLVSSNNCPYFISALTTAFAFSAFKSVYVCPVPTNTIGCPVM